MHKPDAAESRPAPLEGTVRFSIILANADFVSGKQAQQGRHIFQYDLPLAASHYEIMPALSIKAVQCFNTIDHIQGVIERFSNWVVFVYRGDDFSPTWTEHVQRVIEDRRQEKIENCHKLGLDVDMVLQMVSGPNGSMPKRVKNLKAQAAEKDKGE